MIYAIVCAMALCICMVIPVSAVIQEMTMQGEITTIDSDNETLYATFTTSYGCDYGDGEGDPVCGFSDLAEPISSSSLILDSSMITTLAAGDMITVTTLGGGDGQWITVAKMTEDETAGMVATDVWGDIGTLSSFISLSGGYQVTYSTTPDCGNCSGTICTALSADVTVVSGEETTTKTLAPGEETVAGNDESEMKVLFVNGQAPSFGCSETAAMMVGPQSVSNFVVTIVPLTEEAEETLAENDSSVADEPDATVSTEE